MYIFLHPVLSVCRDFILSNKSNQILHSGLAVDSRQHNAPCRSLPSLGSMCFHLVCCSYL